MGHLSQDVRHAFRGLAKSPVFTLIAVLTLAVGIGANSTIFSWTNATLLNPIPGMASPSEVVAVSRDDWYSLAYPTFTDLRDQSRTFSGLTAYATGPISLTGRGKPQRTWGTLVTSNYFDVLRVKPILGRGFLPEEEQSVNGAAVAVISYRLWKNHFHGDPGIVGQTIDINTRPFLVVGVAPPVFQGSTTGSTTGLRSEIWIPMMMAQVLTPEGDTMIRSRKSSWLNAVGRLRPGTGREQAQAELTGLLQQIVRQYPEAATPRSRISLTPLWRAPNGANAFFSKLMPVLMALAGVVLLLACANIANLLLARGIARRREMAVRMSLGASRWRLVRFPYTTLFRSRWRLVRQLLVENLVLSMAGGALAVLITLWMSRHFMDFAPTSELPIWVQVNVDQRVLLATFLFSIATALIFGILPALRASGANPSWALKSESGSVAGGQRQSRLSTGLAVAQIALSLLLLVCAGLFVRSFRATQTFNPGFNPQGVLLEAYDLFLNGYKEPEGIAFDRQVVEKVRALPGVTAVSLADWVPLGFSMNGDEFVPEGYVPAQHERPAAAVAHVSPAYFDTMQIPVLQGRDFSLSDSTDSQPVGRFAAGGHRQPGPGRTLLAATGSRRQAHEGGRQDRGGRRRGAHHRLSPVERGTPAVSVSAALPVLCARSDAACARGRRPAQPGPSGGTDGPPVEWRSSGVRHLYARSAHRDRVLYYPHGRHLRRRIRRACAAAGRRRHLRSHRVQHPPAHP